MQIRSKKQSARVVFVQRYLPTDLEQNDNRNALDAAAHAGRALSRIIAQRACPSRARCTSAHEQTKPTNHPTNKTDETAAALTRKEQKTKLNRKKTKLNQQKKKSSAKVLCVPCKEKLAACGKVALAPVAAPVAAPAAAPVETEDPALNCCIKAAL